MTGKHSRLGVRLRWFAPLIVLAGLAVIWGRVVGSSGGGLPGAGGDVVMHDAGRVRDAAGTLREEFLVRNATSATWRVKRVVSSCSCAGVELATMDVPPGADLAATVTLDLRGKRGRMTVFAFVEFESRARLALGVDCDVQPALRAEPSVVDVGQVAVGKATTVCVRVLHEDGVEVVSWTSSNASILAVARSERLSALELVCTVTPIEYGLLPADLRIEVKSSRGERLDVPVVGRASGAYGCTPSALVLRQGQRSYCTISGLERRFELRGAVGVLAPAGVTVEEMPAPEPVGISRCFVLVAGPGAVDGQVEFSFRSGTGGREIVHARLLIDDT